MHQRSRLECLARRLLVHLAAAESAQFLVNKRQQFLRRLWVAPLHRSEDLGDVGHWLLSPAELKVLRLKIVTAPLPSAPT